MPSRSKLPKGKVQINPLISRDLYETLLKYAEARGKARGVISEIVEEALRLYFSQIPPQGVQVPRGLYTHTEVSEPPGLKRLGRDRVHKVFNEVMSVIREARNLPPHEVLCEIYEYELVDAIRQVRGSDPRTIEKWLKDFQKHELVKKLYETPRGNVYGVGPCID